MSHSLPAIGSISIAPRVCCCCVYTRAVAPGPVSPRGLLPVRGIARPVHGWSLLVFKTRTSNLLCVRARKWRHIPFQRLSRRCRNWLGCRWSRHSIRRWLGGRCSNNQVSTWPRRMTGRRRMAGSMRWRLRRLTAIRDLSSGLVIHHLYNTRNSRDLPGSLLQGLHLIDDKVQLVADGYMQWYVDGQEGYRLVAS